jgi:YD repeat-containing protein
VNATFTASFNSSVNQATITSHLPNGSVCTTTVNSYRSTADFVDEVRVIPPLTLVTATSTTGSAACGSGTSSVTYSYDSQRRLTQFTTPGGPTTYTAWDSSGRPTAGTYSGSSLSYVYNDGARTLTLTTISGAVTSVDTITFDANGTNIMEVVRTGSNVSTTTNTIASTDRVCK